MEALLFPSPPGKGHPVLKLDLDFPAGPSVGVVFDSGRVEHPHGCSHGRSPFVFVAVIDDFLDAALDDRLGALVAGEEGHIQLGPLQAAAPVVQDGIELAVDGIYILGLQGILPLPVPGKLLVGAAYA